MTTDPPPEILPDWMDPLLDWHSDARPTMDTFANDVTYRVIAGTQIALLRQAAACFPGSITHADAAASFETHRREAQAEGLAAGEAISDQDRFVTFLVNRLMLLPRPEGYVLSSIGKDFLRFVDDRDLPARPL